MRFGIWSSATARSSRGALSIEALRFEWLARAVMFVFASWLLGTQGVWVLLLGSDPTGITFVIIVVFTAATVSSGTRARELSRERAALDAAAAR